MCEAVIKRVLTYKNECLKVFKTNPITPGDDSEERIESLYDLALVAADGSRYFDEAVFQEDEASKKNFYAMEICRNARVSSTDDQ